MKKHVVKRLLALALAGIMTLGMVACGSSEAPAAEAPAAEAEAPAAEAAPAEDASAEVGEMYWFSDVSGWGPVTANWSVEDSPATDYIRDEIGLTLKIEQPPTDAATKLGLMIASGDLPDVMSITNDDIIKQLIAADKVWPLEEFLQTYDPESHLLTDFPADIKQAHIDTYGGWYAYPSHMESADNRKVFVPNDQCWVNVVEKGTNMCIMFNTEIMDALGITQEDVSTESGFYAALEKVKTSGHLVDGQSVLPVVFHWNDWINQSLDAAIAWNFGVVPVNAEGNYTTRELHPGYKSALKFCNTLVQNGYLDLNTLTIDEAAGKTYLDAKRVFCWIGNQAQQDKTNMPWVSYGPILADNGATPAEPVSMAAGLGWIKTLVAKDCENPEKIAKLLSWASSREGLLVNYYGIEGTDWTIDDKGVVTRTEEGAKIYAENYDNNVLFWPFANTSFERNTEPVPDPTSNRGVEIALMPAIGSHESTYVYDSSLLEFESSNVVEPSSDLGIALSQIETYLESQKAKIVTAADDATFEAEYQNMIDTLNEYGVAEIDAEYDKVYKEYCEKKGKTIEERNAHLYE